MTVVRHLLALRHLAVLICAAALLMKLIVPAGYMIGNDHSSFTIMVCPGTATTTVDDDMAAMHHDAPDRGAPTDHGKVDMPCAYAGLSAQVLGAVDPVMLVAALAVVAGMALRTRPRALLPVAPYLRPPLRGPPLPST
ncbi:hypothetical protein ASE95_05625 [Sphingomonas sp. Leaf231]|uniref:DUF2946 family protein n=1 Tax=Sphingomonas sp. Leaf231 TaxID=1736301 RepID=UPI0006F6CDBD|nr:DUF2946 family protein [Sphingomonas sp. Leaf231]KQN94313.1 hypothetical protein ASE95_05625 [Sphingomonas sp. Leaf231]